MTNEKTNNTVNVQNEKENGTIDTTLMQLKKDVEHASKLLEIEIKKRDNIQYQYDKQNDEKKKNAMFVILGNMEKSVKTHTEKLEERKKALNKYISDNNIVESIHIEYKENSLYSLEDIKTMLLDSSSKIPLQPVQPIYTTLENFQIVQECINNRQYFLYMDTVQKLYKVPNKYELTKPYNRISYNLSKEDKNEISTRKCNEKFHSMQGVKGINITKMSTMENVIYKRIVEHKQGFENVRGYRLQLAHILIDTSYIWLENDKNEFNEKNYATLSLIARIIKTIAQKDKLFLGIKATKNKNGFLLVKVANSLEAWKKFFDIVDIKKNKASDDERNQNEKASVKENDDDERNQNASDERKAIEKEIKNDCSLIMNNILDNLLLIASDKKVKMSDRIEQLKHTINSEKENIKNLMK